MTRRGWSDFAILFAVLALPLAGAALTRVDLDDLFLFPPPRDIPSQYLRFSWAAAIAVLALLVSIAASWIVAVRRKSVPAAWELPPPHARARGPFPWWGWLALGWTIGFWALAWTRLSWFESFQRYTFFPLWLGFIVTVNALTQRRTGTCTMQRTPGTWAGLFAASALFWWVFEWLNRFVRNWHYLATDDARAAEYAFHATLCFSTVLPAVAAVAEWLLSHPYWAARTTAGPAWTWLERRVTAGGLIVAGVSTLVLAGAYPAWFYPAVWTAPLALGLGAPLLTRRPGLAGELGRGDWRRGATWMTAALICGFFWELWNWYSLAKWIYTVPGVERWHLFEMPLLGYVGYLPFGLECLLVVERLSGRASVPPIAASPASLNAGYARGRTSCDAR